MKHTRFSLTIISALCAAGFSLSAASVDGPLFMGLGDLPGGIFISVARNISGDGTVVVGQSHSENGYEAFRWSLDSGMVGLGDLPGGYFLSSARAVSRNGSVIVGVGAPDFGPGDFSPSPGLEAFLWTEEAGMVGLGDLSEAQPGSRAHDVSADGAVVVGIVSTSGVENGSFGSGSALLWTEDTDMVALGELPGAPPYSEAYAVSGDGTVVVGVAGTAMGSYAAFRWTEETGLQALEPSPKEAPFTSGSTARAISADGQVIVGNTAILAELTGGDSRWTWEAYRWTEDTGVAPLGVLPGAQSSAAHDASYDGSIILGGSTTDDQYEPVLWDEFTGIRRLVDVLTEDYGLDLGAWTIRGAWALSDDGLVIVGQGINPDGNIEGWVACLRDKCFE